MNFNDQSINQQMEFPVWVGRPDVTHRTPWPQSTCEDNGQLDIMVSCIEAEPGMACATMSPIATDRPGVWSRKPIALASLAVLLSKFSFRQSSSRAYYKAPRSIRALKCARSSPQVRLEQPSSVLGAALKCAQGPPSTQQSKSLGWGAKMTHWTAWPESTCEHVTLALSTLWVKAALKQQTTIQANDSHRSLNWWVAVCCSGLSSTKVDKTTPTIDPWPCWQHKLSFLLPLAGQVLHPHSHI